MELFQSKTVEILINHLWANTRRFFIRYYFLPFVVLGFLPLMIMAFMMVNVQAEQNHWLSNTFYVIAVIAFGIGTTM